MYPVSRYVHKMAQKNMLEMKLIFRKKCWDETGRTKKPVITIDSTKEFDESKPVTSITFASTEGTLSFPEHDDITIGLTMYRKITILFFGARDPDTRKVHSRTLASREREDTLLLSLTAHLDPSQLKSAAGLNRSVIFYRSLFFK